MNPTAFCKISALHQNVLYQADISNNKDNEEGIFRSIWNTAQRNRAKEGKYERYRNATELPCQNNNNMKNCKKRLWKSQV